MNKPTSIIHPVPQRRNSLVSAGINDVVSQFNSQEGVENRNVEVAAAYSIPIKVENTGAIDSSLDGFVTPAFIHKNESQINRKKDDKENIKKVLSANLENDRRTFVANMGNDHIEETCNRFI